MYVFNAVLLHLILVVVKMKADKKHCLIKGEVIVATVKKEGMLINVRGKNLLDGLMPKILRFDGVSEPLTARIGTPVANPKYFTYLNTDKYDNIHIDIDGELFALVYDMGEEKQLDFIYFDCLHSPYDSKEIEIYASNNSDDILDEENMLARIDNSNGDALAEINKLRGVKVETEGMSYRYVAFKQNGTFAEDKISRLSHFGAYNLCTTLKDTYITGRYPNNCAPESRVELKGDYLGNPEWITDTKILDHSKEVVINNGEIEFKFLAERKIKKAVVIGKEINEPKVSCGDKYYDSNYTEKQLFANYKEYTLDTKMLESSNKFSLQLKSSKVDEVVLYSENRVVYVDSNKVIAKDFIGIGANVLPTHLFEIARMRGFNEAYMALEACRIKKTNPAVIRLWFQIDWFCMDEQDYYNRKYVFNSPKMQAVYKELDAFKAAGTEIELNFGWKVGYTAQPWFCFKEVFNRRNSAPRDLDQYAIACADCLRELIINRGYDNIKYLSFYNESNAGRPNGYDFVCPEGIEPMLYWTEMLVKVDAVLRKEKLRHLVEFWAAEICNEIIDWADHLNKNAADKYERFSYHKYGLDYNESIKLAEDLKEATGKHPIVMTEFGCYENHSKAYRTFELGNVENIIGSVNGGTTAMTYWILSESCLDEVGLLGGGDAMFWGFPTEDREQGPANVSEEFYSLSLATNYIPKHCNSIVAKAYCNDMHTVGFVTNDGDYTVLVEAKCDTERSLEIKFNNYVNKKFYKHIYKMGCEIEANLIVPPVVDEFMVENSLKDTLSEGYSFVVYTTLPPIRQVVMDEVFKVVKAGETVKLGAKVIDGEGELKWSLCDTYCPTGYSGTISEDGVYTADSTYYTCTITEPFVAVKAQLPTGEYGITVIKIVNC